MQKKDDRLYTFLVTKSSRSRIYIRRVEISKKLVHSTLLAVVMSLGVTSISIAGFAQVQGVESNFNHQYAAQLSNEPQQAVSRVVVDSKVTMPDTKPINYEQPDVIEDTPNNIGGPATPFQLTNAETKAEEDSMEAELKNIEKTSNPEFLPTIWAHMGKINNEFGFRRNPFGGRTYEFHPGMDISGERGEVVIAPANGVVSKAGWSGGYGNLVEIDHLNGLKTRYGHLSKIDVEIGDTIKRSQEIAQIGTTGRSTGPHLHFEIRLNDKAINPRRFLPSEVPN